MSLCVAVCPLHAPDCQASQRRRLSIACTDAQDCQASPMLYSTDCDADEKHNQKHKHNKQ